MNSRLCSYAMTMIGILCLSQVGWSHQMKESISVVTFNPNSGQVEIAHRIYVHDAEVVLKTVLDKNKDLVTDQQAQADFAQYIISRFVLALDGQAVELEFLGQEIDGQHLWIYQEYPYTKEPTVISVSYDAMMEVWPDQRHVINIEGLGPVKSMQLLNDDFSQVIENQVLFEASDDKIGQ